MKEYIIFTMLALVTLMSACQDFLDEESFDRISPENYMNNVEELQTMADGLYVPLCNMFQQTGTLAACMGGDDVTTLPGGNKGGYLQFDIFNAEDNNNRIGLMWSSCYKTIRRANIVINDIDNVMEPADDPEALAEGIAEGLGQAQFARALSYFYLVRIWGEVPLVTDYNEVNNEREKATFQEIYDLIVADLQGAEVNLPESNGDYISSNGHARPTQGSAKSLLASVYLTMGGYPLKATANFALAAAKAKEVIDNEATYNYALLPIDELWSYANNSTDRNTETVFATFYNQDTDPWIFGQANMNAPLAYLPGDAGGWDDLFAELAFFNAYPASPRKDATFLTQVNLADGTTINWQDYAQGNPYYKKYLDVPGWDENAMNNWHGWISSRSMPVIRYAEVLLVHAEAVARSNGNLADAYTSINRVRARAGMPDVTLGLSNTAFADSVVMERAWEFAGNEPNARWFDLVRTETVAAANSKRDPSEVPLVGQPDDQSHTFYFAPIPQVDALINPNL